MREQFFAHVSPGGSVLTDRLKAYTGWRLIGENLAWGEGSRGTPRAIVAAWMASPGHRKNILNGRFTETGVGVVSGTPLGSRQASATYTAEYGTRASDAASRPGRGLRGRPEAVQGREQAGVGRSGPGRPLGGAGRAR